MKKVIVLMVILLVVGYFSFNTVKNKIRSDLSAPVDTSKIATVKPTKALIQTKESSSIFIPYWSLGNAELDVASYDELFYFGVTPTLSGIDTNDSGYKNLQKFVNKSDDAERRFLTLRMLDSKENFTIIENKNARKKVISETLQLADEHDFTGIVLDLEVSAIPFDSVIQNISTFVKEFYKETKNQDKEFYVTVYGDTYYRLRPFDMKVFATHSDKVLIMAYDFHKARGNPGPNFPLSGKANYGYDYKALADNFLDHVSNDKLVVIFGMFGYDWQVNNEGKAVDLGEAISYKQAKKNFIDSCKYAKCEWKRDEVSGEITVTYVDDENKKHIVWFEDPTSSGLKQDYLRKRGITSFSFWSYSYF